MAGAKAATHRDPDALVVVCASDIEFEPSMAGLEVDVYRGHAGIRKWMDDLHAVWDEFSRGRRRFRGNRSGFRPLDGARPRSWERG